MKIFESADALAAEAARWITELANAADAPFAVALSGGNTPKALYRRLADERDFPWARTQWYFGDERFVPPDDPQSNYRMAREAMLFRAPASNVHPVPTVGVTPDEAAARYDEKLRARATKPLFDLVLLGLGGDGHTASLFPGSSALDERERLVCATGNGRITLTYPALENARRIAFLVTGADKRAMLARLRDGDKTIPAGRIAGDVTIFADEAAAG